jgi:type II secretory pathway pseudopilin PulG
MTVEAPDDKHQMTNKHQTPNAKSQTETAHHVPPFRRVAESNVLGGRSAARTATARRVSSRFGAWDLLGSWCLGFGDCRRRRAVGREASNRAFTLIEILIALAIMIIGFVGIMAVFASAIDLHKQGVDQTSAAMIASSALEVMQARVNNGETADELSTREGEGYVFVQSTMYPAYEYKAICTDLNDREVRMILEVRVRPRGSAERAADDTGREGGNIRFETILLRP